MIQTSKNKSTWLSGRTLGLVYWLEAPAIYLLFFILSKGVALILNSKGLEKDTLNIIGMSVLGTGVLVANSYIWLVSKNTSKPIYTVLARISVVISIILLVTMITLGLRQ